MKKYEVIDLFSGVGGFSYGLEKTGHFETKMFCEINKFARKVLSKHWPNVPIHDDIRSFNCEAADVVCGGFPCQPFSTSGKRKGKSDDRYLWPEMVRVISEAGPSWVIGENVSGAASILREIKDDLEDAGYHSEVFNIPASAFGLPHQRQRLWIVANANGERLQALGDSRGGAKIYKGKAPTKSNGIDAVERFWQTASRTDRGDDGVPNRVDRLRCLGNSVTPLIPEFLGNLIVKVDALYE